MATLLEQTQHADTMTRSLTEIPLPKGFRFQRVYFDADHTGELSVFAEFGVSRKLGADRATVRAVGNIRERARELMYELEPDKFTYVRFVPVG